MEDIIKDARGGRVAPVYVLAGTEPYFIDSLSGELTGLLMPEQNRDFDMSLFYGLETDANRIIEACRQFPLLGDRRVVLVREAQQLRGGLEALEPYCKTPSEKTVLILCFKGVDDIRKGAAKAAKALAACGGVIYESKKVYESALPAFISRRLKARGVTIEPKAAEMLVEHVGTDLSRMDSELEKLAGSLSAGEKQVTAAMVEEQTGLSRDYNNYELVSALARKNKTQTLKIVRYFNDNPRSFALTPTLSTLFSFYADLMQAYYAPDKSERGVAEWLGQPDWKVRKDLMPALRIYPARKVMRILSEIRQTDARSKGVEGCRMAPGDLLLELVCFIFD